MPSPTINNAKILFVALLTLALDQLTKWVVIHKLPYNGEPVAVVDGFFELVHLPQYGRGVEPVQRA